MKVLPVNCAALKHNFKGYTVENGAYNYGHRSEAERTGRRLEYTVGTFHPRQTGHIYYADPLENVTDAIRESVDIVVYDDQPALPDMDKEVSKMFFFESNYGDENKYLEQTRKLREYFYRLEMVDKKTIGENERNIWNNIDVQNSEARVAYFKAHVDDAKYNQKTLAKGDAIFYESKGLRDHKDQTAREISALKENIRLRTCDINSVEKELERREGLQSILDAKINVLKEKEKFYTDILANKDTDIKNNTEGKNFAKDVEDYNAIYHRYNAHDFQQLTTPTSTKNYAETCYLLDSNMNDDKSEYGAIAAFMKKASENIKKYTEISLENAKNIKELKKYQKDLPGIIEKLQADLRTKIGIFEKAKADLIPHFEKLKQHYISRGIRVIK